MKNKLRNNTFTILYYQYKSVINFIKRILKNDPLLIALIILIPGFFYISIELTISPEISKYALNPNLMALFNSYNLLFRNICTYMLILVPPVYILLTQINIKLFNKLITANINYKTIALANVFIFIISLDFILFLTLFIILMKTQTTLISTLLFLSLLLFTVNTFIISFYQLNIIIINSFVKKFPKHVGTLEFIILLVNTILLLSIVFIPNNTIFELSSILLILFELLIFLIIFIVFLKLNINVSYILRNSEKRNKVIHKDGNISIFSNYLIMIYNNRKSFYEYILSLLTLYLTLNVSKLFSEMSDLIYQMIIPMFLIPSGIICSYKSWYQLYDKKAFYHIRILDVVISSIVTLFSFLIITLIINKEIIMTNLFVFMITYFICMLTQWKLTLKFNDKNASYFMYIIVYGTLACLIYTMLKLGVAYI